MTHTAVWCNAPAGCNHCLPHHNHKFHKILTWPNATKLLKKHSSFLSLMKHVIPNCTEIATGKVTKILYSP